MSLQSTRARYANLVRSVGRATLNAQFPDDFEYYLCSLELVDSDNKIIDTLIFPVMPDNMMEAKTSITNVKKSNFGVVSLFNPSFNPIQISLGGTFGRKFRILIGDGKANGTAINFRTKEGAEPSAPAFNVSVKTGFGVIKILERIYNRHTDVDSNGLPYRLFFNNFALSNFYLVEMRNLKFNQSIQTNMIWNYSFQMTAIAPSFQVREEFKESLSRVASFGVLNEGFNTAMGSMSNFVTEKLRLQNVI